MRGVHDLGGLPAGPIDRSEHERTFLERRVDAMMRLLAHPMRGHFTVDAVRVSVLLPLCLVLSGCSVALHGNQATSGGATTTTTSAATSGQTSVGPARVSTSFGTPAPQGAAGGQVAFPRGASAVLLLGLVIAETVNYLGAKFSDAPPASSAPQRSIADTCSCYGYQPPNDEDRRLSIKD